MAVSARVVSPAVVAQQVAAHGSLLTAVDHLRRPPRTLQPLPESWLEVLEPYLPETTPADPEQPLTAARVLAYFLGTEGGALPPGHTERSAPSPPAGLQSGLSTWLGTRAWLGLGLQLDWTPVAVWLAYTIGFAVIGQVWL
ncbi:MAG: hypothetical protein U1F76_06765 [Candidatus Competibacteraceae bacterium]